MTLKETKDKVSQSLGYEDWKELVKDQSNFGDAWFDLVVTNVATLQSIEKVKEALKLAADEVRTVYCNCYEPRYDCDGRCREIDKSSITDLETELIENIKNEK